MVRKAPPGKARDSKDQIETGNDGLQYISKPNKNGVYRWVKVKGSVQNKITRAIIGLSEVKNEKCEFSYEGNYSYSGQDNYEIVVCYSDSSIEYYKLISGPIEYGDSDWDSAEDKLIKYQRKLTKRKGVKEYILSGIMNDEETLFVPEMVPYKTDQCLEKDFERLWKDCIASGEEVYNG
jgi:hypothetical protein